MDFDKLSKLIFEEIIPKLEKNKGVYVFAKHRAKFEGWLKVELCESLSKYFQNVVPEKDRIDIVCDDWAIELKTVNTNYRYQSVENKSRPITMNVNGVIKDIEKLEKLKPLNYVNKAILFVVFPVDGSRKMWKNHLQKIQNKLREIKSKEFRFKNEIPGIVYFGLI